MPPENITTGKSCGFSRPSLVCRPFSYCGAWHDSPSRLLPHRNLIGRFALARPCVKGKEIEQMMPPSRFNICHRPEGTFVELLDGTRIAELREGEWTSLHPDWVVAGDANTVQVGYIEHN